MRCLATVSRHTSSRSAQLAETVVRISPPHFVAGLIAVNGVVTRAAPILHWAVGKRLSEVLGYCRRKKWPVDEWSVAEPTGAGSNLPVGSGDHSRDGL